MIDKTLSTLAREVRGKTLKILEGIGEQEARFAAPGLTNSILWHAGHALVVVEHLCVMQLTEELPSYPDDWFEKFSWDSKPETVTEWPTVAQVTSKLRDQLATLVEAIEQADGGKLSSVIGEPGLGRTVRYSVIHGLHDEAKHQGEMWLLRKMYAKRIAQPAVPQTAIA